ncbi:hypothetical protein [Microbacterium imperiale]|uniref:Uncharacterized protein n=1 Tax=Microbacterium imperiale TaxID=33884 RepID=A0A9W6HHJ5_9MICO|nr:hypothetical protein [Microbacterium imperiale]MBP2421339.1 hypothetical protein [Microbacterium imperiale]BFE41679.1 hypothetical protein GCM10017544_26350 [Microbacterium imperiale]GLJ80630.1 hypothetical protein GCM10017586_23130 [Microbacterium imperiale]
MSIVLALTGLAVLLIALVIFVRNQRIGDDGTNRGSTRRGIILLTFFGLVLGLASQLPVFQG